LNKLIELPFPVSFVQIVWLGIGLTFGRAFGKQLDQNIQNSDWFKGLNLVWQNLLKRALDFLHHWWIGALLMVYFGDVEAVFWFGYGLLLDDIPDVPARLKKYFNYLWKNNEK